MPLICRCCGRDLNAIWQDNMSNNSQPLCEDCYYGRNFTFDDEDYDADYYEDWGEWEDDDY